MVLVPPSNIYYELFCAGIHSAIAVECFAKALFAKGSDPRYTHTNNHAHSYMHTSAWTGLA